MTGGPVGRAVRWAAPLIGAVSALGATALMVNTTRDDSPRFHAELLGAAVLLAIGLAAAGWWLLRETRRREAHPPPNRHRVVLTIALLAVLAVGSILGQLDGLLRGFHRSGEGSAGIAALTGISAPWARADLAEPALEGWSRYSRPFPHGLLGDLTPVRPFEQDPDAAVTVITWSLGLDTAVMLPASLALLGLLLIRIGRRLERRVVELGSQDAANRARGFRNAASWAMATLVVGACLDAVENLTALGVTTSSWFDPDAGSVPIRVSEAWGIVLGLAGAGRVAALVLVVAYLLFATAFVAGTAVGPGRGWGHVRGAWQTVLGVRVQLLVVIAFGAALLIHEQVPDAVRRWPDGWTVGSWGIELTALLAFSVWYSGRWSLAFWATRPLGGSRRLAWALAVAAAAVALAFGFLSGAGGWSRGVIAPLGMAAVIGGLSLPLRGRPVAQLSLPLDETAAPRAPEERPGAGRTTLPSFLAASVVAVLGLVMLRASVGHAIYSSMRGREVARLAPLIWLGVVLLTAAGIGYHLLNDRDQGQPLSRAILGRRWVPPLVLLGCVLAWALVARVLADPERSTEAARALGVVGILALFLVLLTYTAASVIALADRLVDRPAPTLRLLGFRRAPAISLVLVWFLLTSVMDLDRDLHVAVQPPDEGTARVGGRLSDAFADWVSANCLLGEEERAGGTSIPAVPMVFVASSGGGIRAAVWTAHVLDAALPRSAGTACDQDSPEAGLASRSHWVFAMSGVSGGALGIASYAVDLQQPGADIDALREELRAELGGDYLSESFARMLFVEAPGALLRFGADTDRADVMERSWESTQPELAQDYFELSEREGVPLLLFNGTSTESGCRFVVSPLEANGRVRTEPSARCLSPLGLAVGREAVLPATAELVDFLCADQPIALSTAVLLSARFPVISPSGEVRQCAPEPGPVPKTFAVDGGYLEGSGAATALDLWNALAPAVAAHNADPHATACVVPTFVQIDNGYEEAAGPGEVVEPPQFIVPLTTFRATREGRTAAARQAAQVAFDRSFALGGIEVMTADGEPLETRYAHFSTLAHPGERAPLGWALSRDSFNDLVEELLRSQFGPDDATGAERIRPDSGLDRVRSWFSGMTCSLPD